MFVVKNSNIFLIDFVFYSFRYTAVYDVQNRVLLMDNSIGTVIHIWKGYHHAQFGWIHTMNEKSQENFGTGEFAILLVIYLPRRGLIEIWSPDQKSRVAHFPVSKRGQLLLACNAVLDTKQSSAPRNLTTAFLTPDGKIAQIFVPIHALTDKSSVHDSNLQAKLEAILQEQNVSSEELIDLIKAAKSAMSKLQMAREILRNTDGKLQVSICREVIMSLEAQVEISQMAKKHCSVMSKALDLFKYLDDLSDEFQSLNDLRDEEKIQKAFKCNSIDACNFNDIFKYCQESDNYEICKNLTMENFMSCFHFLQDNEDSNKEILPLRFKNTDVSMLKFLQTLSQASRLSFEETVQNLRNANLRGQDLLSVLLKNLLEYGLQKFACDIDSSFSCFQLCFDLHEAEEEIGNFQIMLQMARSFLTKSDMSIDLFCVMFLWKSYLKQSENLASYSEDWGQILHFVKCFVEIKSHATAENFITNSDIFTYKDVFLSGNGKIVEVLISWLADQSYKLPDIGNEKCQKLLKVATLHFPCSFNKNILAAHMSWEYVHRWNKDKSKLDLLRNAYEFLKNGIENCPELQHRLMRLIWNVLLEKPVKDGVNLTEIPSASRCERELGFSQDNLPQFLSTAYDFLTVHQDTLNNQMDDIRLSYDVTCNDVGSMR